MIHLRFAGFETAPRYVQVMIGGGIVMFALFMRIQSLLLPELRTAVQAEDWVAGAGVLGRIRRMVGSIWRLAWRWLRWRVRGYWFDSGWAFELWLLREGRQVFAESLAAPMRSSAPACIAGKPAPTSVSGQLLLSLYALLVRLDIEVGTTGAPPDLRHAPRRTAVPLQA
jgi:hypothetical protein